MQYKTFTKSESFIFLNFVHIFFVDSVASTFQSTVDSTQKVAQSSIDTGKSYATSARGK